MPYEEAKSRCEISKDAQVVEFLDEKEWREVKKYCSNLICDL